MREIFLNCLPRFLRGGKECIDWKNSVGFKIPFIHDDIDGELVVVKYIYSSVPKVDIKYENKIKSINITNLRNGMIGNLIDKKTSDFKINIGETFCDKKRDITIISAMHRHRENTNTNNKDKCYEYRCNKCGNLGLITESHILKGCGCSCTNNSKIILGYNDIPTTAPWMIKYFQGGYEEAKNYTKSSGRLIFPICPDCYMVKQKAMKINTIFNHKSIGCICGDGISFPNRFMSCILNQLEIEYIAEYSPNWLKGYKGSKRNARFDFYLPDQNLIIEMDGCGHGRDSHSYSIITKEEAVKKDEWKDLMAFQHNLLVVRIDSYNSELEYLKNNILYKLGDILNLSLIDWVKVDVFATRNLVKIICDGYEIEKLSMKELASKFNLNYNTIYKYLLKGKKYGWCSYDSKKSKTKIVRIYKDGQYINTYDSVMDLVRNSISDFSIKFHSGAISRVANGKSEQHQGYTFDYVNTN